MKKDFLALTDWSKTELDQMFDLTRELKTKQKNGEPPAANSDFQCELLFVVRNLRADPKPPAAEGD